MMLGFRTEQYRTPAPEEDIRQGLYFPDAVIDPIARRVVDIPPGADHHVPVPPSAKAVISLRQAKALIAETLDRFDPALGAKAAEIFQNPARLNVYEVGPGEGRMMVCRAAGLTMEDLRKQDMVITDPEILERFPVQDNPGGPAVIDYEFDGTVNGVIYLAHELGHAIADDYQIESGHSFRQNPQHMVEFQAYLIQNIVSSALEQSSDKTISPPARQSVLYETGQSGEDMAQALGALEALRRGNESPEALHRQAARLHGKGRATGFLTAAALAGHLWDADQSTRRQTVEWALGRRGPKNINEVLAQAGIERPDDMTRLVSTLRLGPEDRGPDARPVPAAQPGGSHS